MSSTLDIVPNNSALEKPRPLSRREALKLLAVAPFALAALPAPVGDPLACVPTEGTATDRAAYLALVLIPLHEELLAAARRELATLGGGR